MTAATRVVEPITDPFSAPLASVGGANGAENEGRSQQALGLGFRLVAGELGVGDGEGVPAVLLDEDVVHPRPRLGRQRRLEGRAAGRRDRRGDQALAQAGVVRVVVGQVALAQRLGGPVERVADGGVDAERPALLQPVVDDLGHLGPLVVDLRLLLHHGRHNDRLVRRQPHLLLGLIEAELPRHGVERLDHALQDRQLVVLGIQVVRLRQEQPFEVGALRGLEPRAHGPAAGQLQEPLGRAVGQLPHPGGDLLQREALGDGEAVELELGALLEDLHHVAVALVLAERVGAGLERARAAHLQVDAEEPGVADDALVVEDGGDPLRRGPERDLHRHLRPARWAPDLRRDPEADHGGEQETDDGHAEQDLGPPREAAPGLGHGLDDHRLVVVERRHRPRPSSFWPAKSGPWPGFRRPERESSQAWSITAAAALSMASRRFFTPATRSARSALTVVSRSSYDSTGTGRTAASSSTSASAASAAGPRSPDNDSGSPTTTRWASVSATTAAMAAWSAARSPRRWMTEYGEASVPVASLVAT